MSELDKLLTGSDLAVPEVLYQLPHHQQQEVISWVRNLVSHNTEGLDDLYNAISMIVKYIPHFMVIPLMVEHIRPRIAAGAPLGGRWARPLWPSTPQAAPPPCDGAVETAPPSTARLSPAL